MHLPKIMIGQSDRPLICTPLVGGSRNAVLTQLNQVLQKQPDIIEWRADFFDDIADPEAVRALAARIRLLAGDTPVIFTIRSACEGGQLIALSDHEIIAVSEMICRTGSVDYIDCELRQEREKIAGLRQIAKQTNTKIIGSYHNFRNTPSRRVIVEKLAEAATKGMDVAKVAVMPQSLDDVLVLLGATLEAQARLSIPLITMAMGSWGIISRMAGGAFGSALTFAVGAEASAPGQIPIADLRTVLQIIQRTMHSDQ